MLDAGHSDRHLGRGRRSRTLRLVGAAAALAAIAAGCGSYGAGEAPTDPPAPPRLAGPPPPPLSLPTLDGRRVTLEELRGRTVIVSFWATWCAPCRREMPSLVALHERLRERGLEVLAVSIDEDVAALRRFLRATPLPFHILLDTDRSAYADYGVTVTPTAFIVDPRGRVVDRVEGAADWSDPELVRTLEAVLASGAEPAASRT